MEAAPRAVPVQARRVDALPASALKISHPFFGPNGAFGLSDSTLHGGATRLASRVERARLAQPLSLQVGARSHFTIQTAQPSQEFEAFVDESPGRARFRKGAGARDKADARRFQTPQGGVVAETHLRTCQRN